MATDDIKVRESSGGRSIRADDVGGSLVQSVKIMKGGDGQDQGFVSEANEMPVKVPAGKRLAVDLAAGQIASNPLFASIIGPVTMALGEPTAYADTLTAAEVTLPDAAENFSLLSVNSVPATIEDLSHIEYSGPNNRLLLVSLVAGSGPVRMITGSGNLIMNKRAWLFDETDRVLLQYSGGVWYEIARACAAKVNLRSPNNGGARHGGQVGTVLPASGPVLFSPSVALGGLWDKFDDGFDRSIAFMDRIPEGIVPGTPLEISILWSGSAAAGDMEWLTSLTVADEGDSAQSALLPESNVSHITTMAGIADVINYAHIEHTPPSPLSRESVVAVHIRRDATAPNLNDTMAGDATILDVEFEVFIRGEG